ncbi:SDR family NAD(P)-dependent oxidoreductase [Sphingobium yanoikuyae]|uniref:SDR family NAD(P)-dependent oxidoreductase n=1 Tax=Sphingobium yanoikuyae TaxID=13690 RepID=UPI0022DD5220|nr:SDR family NAD(P)-dependent oxidoreductase [Sphingobium yanoikuyae]WBQ19336.1 SDR family NAD(P)-dependent oxidoreductase [Sphingobium yanoikuyae]
MEDRAGGDGTGNMTAAVFGASGAIGGSMAASLAKNGRFSAVMAGSRAAILPVAGCRPFRFDLDDEVSIAEAVAALPQPIGLVLVCTGLLHDQASSIVPEKTLRALDGATLARLYAVNAIGPALIAKHVMPRLPRQGRCVFAVLSAKVGSIGDNRLGGWHAYRASKAALNMMIRNFAIEMRRTHPQAIVAALHPGTVESNLSAPFRRGVPSDKLFTPDYAAEKLLGVVDRLTPADSGGLFAWDGVRLPD